MLINFSTPILNLEGNQTVVRVDGVDTPLLLARVVTTALNAPAEKALPFAESLKRGMLALQITDGGEHEMKPEDLALMRSVLPHAWSPIVVARAASLLE